MARLPKVLAIYLPQFYQTPDNDKWWGEGFTDWDTVKSSQSYFDGQIAPRVPLEKDYYDLSKYESIKKQVELAKKYGVDGFCIYHYYFENGKRELEIPEKLILEHKELAIQYCLNWASESWVRSWSRIQGNVWAERYDDIGKDSKAGVLVRQNYGDKKQWEKHFRDLLPHFKDERYIKIDGKPVFIFYNTEDIQCLEPMTKCWRELAKEEGLPGLYLIGARMKYENASLDGSLIYEPRNSINRINNNNKSTMENGVRCYDYSDFWNEIIETSPMQRMKTYFSGAVDYDDTPRRGDKGECLINVSCKTFSEGVKELLAKSIAEGNELVFINAWNEWGEGMYIEPDERRKYGMLEAIMEAKKSVTDEDIIKYRHKEESQKMVDDEASYNARKFKELFEVADAWLYAAQDNKNIVSEFLREKGFSSFAIYGMSSLGKHLLRQARKEGIEPIYGIDRYVGQFGKDFKIYRPEEDLPAVDCVVVTAYDYEQISNFLNEKMETHVIYLGDVIRNFGV